ncbi:MAG: SUMF1/EgtB/PvdO family nonheme iron enzyme [Pirellulales bacterium]
MGAGWWRQVAGACWHSPEGPSSNVEDRLDHPVVHVSWNDARHYALSVVGRLPGEAEWEYAARDGLDQRRYPWGDDLTPGGRWRCNIWQGSFPLENTAEDGYLGTAPVNAYEPSGLGLFNMVGNVWEWCADEFRGAPGQPPRGRVLRGGSYLCHESYCNRYRVSARTFSGPESSAGNVGIRVAWDAPA